MPSRPRRALLRSIGATGIALLAGCNTASEETTDTTAGTTTASTTETITSTETTTEAETETPGDMAEGPAQLPETVWPLPHRGPANGGYLPDGPLVDAEPVIDWQVDPTVPPDQDAYAPDFTEPVIAEGRLYTVNRLRITPEVERPEAHFLRAFDPETGEQAWEYTIEQGSGREIPTSPAVGDGVVFVGQGKRLHAVDPGTETTAWSRTFAESIDAVYPCRDWTYVQAHHSIVALAPDTERRWTKEFDSVPDTIATGTDNLYLTVSRQLVALDPTTGDVRWQQSLPAVEGGYAVKDLVAVEGGVFALQHSGDLHAYNTSGERVWGGEDRYQSISTDGVRLYAGGEGLLRALAVGTGATVWEVACEDIADCAGDSTFRKPVLTDTALYTSLTSGRLLAVRPTEGTIRWGFDAPMDGMHLSLGSEAIYAIGGELDPLVKLQAPEA